MISDMKKKLATTLLLGAVALMCLQGCGGDSGSEGDAGDPGEAIRPYLHAIQEGQYGRAWDMLHPAHQAVVTRSEFDNCLRESGLSVPAKFGLHVDVVSDETIDVAGLGSTPTKAVTWTLSSGEEFETMTSHLVESDGTWRWILTDGDYEAYQKGECPS